MQAEIDLMLTPVAVDILGVNAPGQESGNALMYTGRVLPWLQDDDAQDAWVLWSVDYRDVIILDPLNRVSAIYNLTTHDLADPVNYAELKALLVAATGP